MKEMIWDNANQTCNPIKTSPTKGAGDTPASTNPPGQPDNSETSDRTPESPKPTGSEKVKTTATDPATKTPRAPAEMKK